MTDTDEKYLNKLHLRGIKPTAMRLLILRAMMSHSEAFSLQSLEEWLQTVDKSTIYRTITLFLTHHLIHAIDDGTGSFKYAVCGDNCHCGEEDEDLEQDFHAHFSCTRCGKTYCLDSIHVPVVSLPMGFRVHDVNYVLKGVCSACGGEK